MPVWHRLTEAWRKDGRLQVVGIVQEQHPDRARLFAQWHEIDWPILWDPLSITGSAAVPNLTLVDEHGIVRSRRPDATTIESAFIERDFPPPGSVAAAESEEKRVLLPVEMLPTHSPRRAYWDALSALLSMQAHIEPDSLPDYDEALLRREMGLFHD